MSEVEKKLKEFAEYLKKINHYTTAGNLMYWDMTTGMPEAMAESRAETLSFFQTEVHSLNVSPKIAEFIEFFESHMGEFDYIHKRMTEQLKKKYENQEISRRIYQGIFTSSIKRRSGMGKSKKC